MVFVGIVSNQCKLGAIQVSWSSSNAKSVAVTQAVQNFLNY
jgi:hypothetical protein